jgi:hypothetical protein
VAFTYDTTTDRGKVRLLATDTDVTRAIFDDAEIDAFLAIEESVFPAAALALETIAVNEALVQKRIKILDLQTDGPAVAVALLKRAKELRAREAEETIPFAVAETCDDFLQRREKRAKEAGL